VLVLEPSLPGGAAKTSRKGCGEFELLVHGVPAHAGLDPGKLQAAVPSGDCRYRRIDASVALRKLEQRSPAAPAVACRAEAPQPAIGRLGFPLLLRQVDSIANQHPRRARAIEHDPRLIPLRSLYFLLLYPPLLVRTPPDISLNEWSVPRVSRIEHQVE
jgi:acetylornithine deacetylase/succinyl-diaminopimelate desuccinylase-like protein